MDHGADPAGAPAGGGGRYGLLDVWRGLACLMVAVHHAGYAIGFDEARGSWPRWLVWLAVRRADLGVTLFFVVSGYCIAASLDATRRRGERPAAFLARRVWRIYPPYWAALLGLVAAVTALDAAGLARLYRNDLGVKLDPVAALDWPHWLGNLTLTETWRPHVAGPPRNVFTGVAWSLCFEEQFYLVGFLALWLAPARAGRALAAATAAIVAVRLGFALSGRLDALSGTFPLLWHEFAAGLAVYYRLHRARSLAARRLAEAGLVAMGAVGVASGERGTAVAAAFALALAALWRWDAASERLAWLEPLRACGRRCYSIYLAHLPVGVAVNQCLYEAGVRGFWGRALVMVPLAAALGVVLGWLFYAAVERPFLRPPTWPGGRWADGRRSPNRRGPRLAGAGGPDVGR